MTRFIVVASKGPRPDPGTLDRLVWFATPLNSGLVDRRDVRVGLLWHDEPEHPNGPDGYTVYAKVDVLEGFPSMIRRLCANSLLTPLEVWRDVTIILYGAWSPADIQLVTNRVLGPHTLVPRRMYHDKSGNHYLVPEHIRGPEPSHDLE